MEAPVSIERLQIHHFKRIKNVDIQIGKFNLITGPNNNGKTSLLHACILAFDALAKVARIDSVEDINFSFTTNRQGGRGKLLYKDDISFFIKNPFEAIHDKNQAEPSQIIIHFSNGITLSLLLEMAPHFLRVVIENKEELEKNPVAVRHLLKYRPLYVPSFSGIDPHEPYLFPGQIRRLLGEGIAGHTLKNLIFQVSKNATKMEILQQSVRNYLGQGFQEFIIETDPEWDTEIVVRYKQNKKLYELATMGSGFLQLVGVLSLCLHFDESETILLDEPDAHLHAGLQQSLLGILQDLSEGHIGGKERQMIVASHSPELINNTTSQHLFYIQNGKCLGSITNTNEMTELLDNLGLGNFEAIKARNTGKLLIAENRSDYNTIRKWAALLGTPNSQLAKLDLCGKLFLKNRDWKQISKNMLQQIFGNSIVSIILLDRDGRTDTHIDNERADLLKRFDKCLIWNRTMIESYYIVPEVIMRAVNNETNQKIGISEIAILINQACDSMKDEAIQYVFTFASDKDARDLFKTSEGRILDEAQRLRFVMQYINDKWTTLEGRLSVIKGKDILSKVISLVQETHKVHLSQEKLRQNFNTETVHPDIQQCVQTLLACLC